MYQDRVERARTANSRERRDSDEELPPNPLVTAVQRARAAAGGLQTGAAQAAQLVGRAASEAGRAASEAGRASAALLSTRDDATTDDAGASSEGSVTSPGAVLNMVRNASFQKIAKVGQDVADLTRDITSKSVSFGARRTTTTPPASKQSADTVQTAHAVPDVRELVSIQRPLGLRAADAHFRCRCCSEPEVARSPPPCADDRERG